MKTERWQAINHHLVVDEASKKAVIVKDKDKKILNDPLAVKTLVDTEGQPVKTARTKLIRDTLRSKIKLEPLSVKRQFNDKGEYENAKKAENLLSNRPAEQYKQVKAELKFFGQSFLEGFLGFYGLEVDNALAEYENTLQVLEEQELGQPDKSYYIGVFKKGEPQIFYAPTNDKKQKVLIIVDNAITIAGSDEQEATFMYRAEFDPVKNQFVSLKNAGTLNE